MKKPTPVKAAKNRKNTKNGTGRRSLPKNLSPAVAQAVLEDAVMEAAADIAALSATLELRTEPETTEPDIVIGAIVPETPEEQEMLELIGVPLLGPSRVRALADLGIFTLADLQAAPPEQIAGIKGVGVNHAKRIKDWVAQQSLSGTAPQMSAPLAPMTLPDTESVTASNLDPVLGDINQAIVDELGEVDGAIIRLTERLGPPSKSKRLRRQLEKVSTVASELAEGPDTVPTDDVQKAVELLGQIAFLLDCAAAEKKLTAKKLDGLRAALRTLRKSLQKALGE